MYIRNFTNKTVKKAEITCDKVFFDSEGKSSKARRGKEKTDENKRTKEKRRFGPSSLEKN